MAHGPTPGNPSPADSPEIPLYRKFAVRTWNDPTFRAAGLDGVFVYLTLRTCPLTCRIPGVLVTGAYGLLDLLPFDSNMVSGMVSGTASDPLAWLQGALRKLADSGLVEMDLANRLIFLPLAIRDDFPNSSKVVKGWRRDWDALPTCPLKDQIHQRFMAEFAGKPNLAEAFALITGEGKDASRVATGGRASGNDTGYHIGNDMPYQEQEQEQEIGEGIPPPTPSGGEEREGTSTSSRRARKQKTPAAGEPPDFLAFWTAYPTRRRTGREEALERWRKLDPSPELAGQILAGLRAWLACEDWTKDGGRWIPAPAKFLADRKWESAPHAPAPYQPPGCPPSAMRGGGDVSSRAYELEKKYAEHVRPGTNQPAWCEILGLHARGIDLLRLWAAVKRYAEHCDRQALPPAERLGARDFFTADRWRKWEPAADPEGNQAPALPADAAGRNGHVPAPGPT